MPVLTTFPKMVAHARTGTHWRDKRLAFLLAGFGVIGRHRKKLRDFYYQSIEGFVKDGKLRLNLSIHGQPTTFEMRGGNEGDYLIGSELVKGSYSNPDFNPQSIVDAGANIGSFSIHASRFFPNAQLICYEPDESNFVLLQKNLSLNGINARLEKAGVWSKNCTLYYHVQTSETGFISEQPSAHPIICKLPDIGPDCWLKIDVEGAEYEVLPALFANKNYSRRISMEIHEHNIRGATMLSLLQQHGYQVDGGEDLTPDCTTISAVRQIASH